jgi:hypothetical protein
VATLVAFEDGGPWNKKKSLFKLKIIIITLIVRKSLLRNSSSKILTYFE